MLRARCENKRLKKPLKTSKIFSRKLLLIKNNRLVLKKKLLDLKLSTYFVFSNMINQITSNSYDKIPYPSLVYPDTHPERLATLARLFGIKSPLITKSRILELGCGDGTHLIAIAQTLPKNAGVLIVLRHQLQPDKRPLKPFNYRILRLNNLILVQLMNHGGNLMISLHMAFIHGYLKNSKISSLKAD